MLRMKGVVARARSEGGPIIDDADLDIDLGEVRVVYGDSGSGKTTLLRLLAGLEQPDEGAVTVAGHDLSKLRPSSLRRMRRRIAFVEESPLFLERKSCLDNVALGGEIAGLPASEIRICALESLASAGLEHDIDTPVRALSRSARRRLAFARALAWDPIVLLADEPERDLDETGRDQIFTMIEELASGGASCLVTSGDHQMIELAELWSWPVSELRDGAVVPFHEVTPATTAERGQLLPFPLAARAGGGNP